MKWQNWVTKGGEGTGGTGPGTRGTLAHAQPRPLSLLGPGLLAAVVIPRRHAALDLLARLRLAQPLCLLKRLAQIKHAVGHRHLREGGGVVGKCELVWRGCSWRWLWRAAVAIRVLASSNLAAKAAPSAALVPSCVPRPPPATSRGTAAAGWSGLLVGSSGNDGGEAGRQREDLLAGAARSSGSAQNPAAVDARTIATPAPAPGTHAPASPSALAPKMKVMR